MGEGGSWLAGGKKTRAVKSQETQGMRKERCALRFSAVLRCALRVDCVACRACLRTLLAELCCCSRRWPPHLLRAWSAQALPAQAAEPPKGSMPQAAKRSVGATLLGSTLLEPTLLRAWNARAHAIYTKKAYRVYRLLETL